MQHFSSLARSSSGSRAGGVRRAPENFGELRGASGISGDLQKAPGSFGRDLRRKTESSEELQ
eukprot:13452483-Alexandrium_andersonii.AAC.1